MQSSLKWWMYEDESHMYKLQTVRCELDNLPIFICPNLTHINFVAPNWSGKIWHLFNFLHHQSTFYNGIVPILLIFLLLLFFHFFHLSRYLVNIFNHADPWAPYNFHVSRWIPWVKHSLDRNCRPCPKEVPHV